VPPAGETSQVADPHDGVDNENLVLIPGRARATRAGVRATSDPIPRITACDRPVRRWAAALAIVVPVSMPFCYAPPWTPWRRSPPASGR
jgi:hypothetical protein